MKLGRKVIAVLAMLFVCVGFVRGANAAEVKVAEQLIVLTGADASTFDPHMCTDSATEIFNKNIYNNLVRFNDKMEIIPDLAEKWSVSEDGCTLDLQFENRREIPRRD